QAGAHRTQVRRLKLHLVMLPRTGPPFLLARVFVGVFSESSTTTEVAPPFGSRVFDLVGTSNEVGTRSVAFLAKGGSRECCRKWVVTKGAVANQIAHAASLPTLA